MQCVCVCARAHACVSELTSCCVVGSSNELSTFTPGSFSMTAHMSLVSTTEASEHGFTCLCMCAYVRVSASVCVCVFNERSLRTTVRACMIHTELYKHTYTIIAHRERESQRGEIQTNISGRLYAAEDHTRLATLQSESKSNVIL